MRWLPFFVALIIALPAQAASLRDMRLQETLEQVAAQSSQGTPRAVNEDITDEGFSVEHHQLVNHLSVKADYAQRLQSDPLVVRSQLQSSVCADQRFRRLLDMGATLTYHFVIADSNQPVLTQSFVSEHCQAL